MIDIVTDEDNEKLKRAAIAIYTAYHVHHTADKAIEDVHTQTGVEKRTLLGMWYTVQSFVGQFD